MHLFAALAVAAAEIGDEGQEWVTLIGVRETSEWRPKQTGWLTANVVSHDSIDNNRLRAVPESGIQISKGDAHSANLLGRDVFQDVDVHLESLIPRGSNSGVNLIDLYEIKIRDS